MTRTVLVRYGELALKSEPVRRRFERRLVSNMNLALKGLRYLMRRERGRIFVDTSSPTSITKRLTKVPGIVSVSPSIRVAASMDEIRSAAIKTAKKILGPGLSFALRTSRVGKHPFSSKDVNVEVGSAILSEIRGARVDLSSPDREIFVEIREKDAYVFAESVDGVGGLPVGTQGRAVALLTGSCNDVFAAYLMMKRGCSVYPAFLDPRPHVDGQALRLAIASAKRLADFDPRLELRVLPSGKILSALSEMTAGAAYCVYKRSALRAAEAVAKRVGAEAVVVGDDAGELAAQKLANLITIDDACGLPVLRPLAGMDDTQISRLEIKMGPLPRFKKVCLLKPPTDVVKLEDVQKLEDEIKIDTLIKDSLSNLRIIKLR